MSTPITVYGDVDARAVEQLQRCADAGDALRGALCADGHVGYSQPIGGAVAYADHISPSGVGYDIACGNKAARTNLRADDIRADLERDHGLDLRRVIFGVGRRNNEPVEHEVLDRIKVAEFEPQRALHETAAKQLGTVGAGNHYVDLFEDEEGWVWVGVHFGSRGFGHRTASGFLALAQGLAFDGHAKEGEMDSPPVLFHVDSELGQSYIAAMNLAGEYAYAGRDTVVAKVLEILGAQETESVHNHHNFAWRENHFGTDVWVIRKGCTPAFPGQDGFVGATMGEPSVILRGSDSGASRELLYSTVHGAGRVMSRTKAAGKLRTRAECSVRDCDTHVPVEASATTEVPAAPGREVGQAAPDRRAGADRLRGRAAGALDRGDRAARRRGRRGAGRVQAPGPGAGRARRHDRDRAPADAAGRGDGGRGDVRPIQGLTDTGWERLREGEWALARECFAAADGGRGARGAELGGVVAGRRGDRVRRPRARVPRSTASAATPAAAARMAIWIGVDQNDFHGAATVAAGWFERARRLLEPLPARARARLARVPRGLPARAATASGRALAAARRSAAGFDVADLEMLGLALEGALAGRRRARCRRGWRGSDEATVIAFEGRAQIPISAAWTCCFLVSSCLAVYDFERAFAWIGPDRGVRRALRQPLDARLLPRRVRRRARWRGRWDEAEALLEAAIEDFTRSRPAWASGPLAGLAELRRRQGRTRRGARAARPRRPDRAPAELCRARRGDTGDAAARRAPAAPRPRARLDRARSSTCSERRRP